MATLYYIKNTTTSVETELSAAQGSGLTVSRKAGAVSSASWQCAAPFDSAPVWPYGTPVAVIRKVDGTPETLFQGKIVRAEGDGSPASEFISYVAADAWWDLENEIYEQTRKIMSSGGSLADAVYGRVILCQSDTGTRLTAAAMCSALVSYAASLGISVQPGTFDAPVTPPWDEIRDKTVAELILRTLKWQPDALPWIDHSTTPPTLNVTRRSSMSALTLALTSLGSCRLRSRPDLQRPGVRITFELANSYGNTVEIQEAGDPDALGCARMTVPLEFNPGVPGPVQEIKVVALGDYTTVAWWKAIFPWLPDTATITDAAASPAIPEGYVSVLKAGVITDWLKDERDLGALTVRISCKAAFTADDQTFTEKALSRSFTLTNAESLRYYGRFYSGYVEAVPSGLAAAFYAACGSLQYGGSVSLIEEDCSAGRAALGKSLNVTGGLTAWSTMSAPVEQVDESFDDGTTVIAVGPQSHLFPQDLIELIRASRLRSTLTPLSRTDAGVPALDETAADPFAPEEQSADSPGKLKDLVLTDPET